MRPGFLLLSLLVVVFISIVLYSERLFFSSSSSSSSSTSILTDDRKTDKEQERKYADDSSDGNSDNHDSSDNYNWINIARRLSDPKLDFKTGMEALFIQPNWTLVEKEFRDQPRIVVDFPFHKFTDRFGLINIDLNDTNLVAAIRDVTQTWAKANIFSRFRFSDVLTSESLTPSRADGYRYWVMGRKTKEDGLDKWQDDYNKILRDGPGKLGEPEARKALKRINEYGGHSYQNWVLGLRGVEPSETIFFHVFTVGLWKWYNGGTTKGRIFVRGGSCHSSKPKYIDGRKVICEGWKNENEVGDMSATEFARILAHEIGHGFHLPHPDTTCQRALTTAGMQLMRQQRAVTLKNGPDCSYVDLTFVLYSANKTLTHI
jgi:hypothetical protein